MKYLMVRAKLEYSNNGYQVDVIDPRLVTWDDYLNSNELASYYLAPLMDCDEVNGLCYALIEKHGYNDPKVVAIYESYNYAKHDMETMYPKGGGRLELSYGLQIVGACAVNYD